MKQKLLSFGGRTPRAPDRAQAAAAAGARRRRKRTGRQTLYYLLILLVAAAVVAVLSLTVFFRIEKLEVAGVTKYAAEEIIEASGVKVGDNLFRVNARRVEKKLTQQFPYVEGVALRRTLPATLTLEIAQAKPLGAVSTAAGYVVIGKTGRVLEIGAASVPQDVMTVTGMYLYDPKVGQKLGEGYTKEETDEADKEAYGFLLLSRLMDAVEETDFGKVSLVDFSNQLDMMLVYDNRLLIDLGGGTELPYKLRFAKKVIEDELSDTFEGRLDVSLAPTTNEIYSWPGDIRQELEKRRLTAAAQAGEGDKKPTVHSDNPDLAVLPGTAPSRGAEAAGSSSEEAASSASPQDDLFATIPGTAPSSAPEESSAASSEAAPESSPPASPAA